MSTVTVTDAGTMEPSDFIASLVHSLAWPVLILAVIFLFRGQIAAFIDRTRKASGFGVTIEAYDEAAKETRAAVETMRPSAQQPASKYLVELPELLPERVGRIVRTWGEIEAWLRSKVRPQGLDPSPPTVALIDAAVREGVVTPDQAQVLRGLYSMRNLAVHGRPEDIDDRRMQEFLALALATRTVLNIPSGA